MWDGMRALRPCNGLERPREYFKRQETVTETTPRPAVAAVSHAPMPALWWDEAAGQLAMVDQTRLPGELDILHPSTAAEIAEAIRVMRVRGAPAIGVAAAYGLWFGASEVLASVTNPNEALAKLRTVADELRATRPTAVNLGWALDRGLAAAERALTDGAAVDTLPARLHTEARAIADEDAAACAAMGLQGARFIDDDDVVLTHCNAGSLATAGIGTALAPIYLAHAAGKQFDVYVNETRPRLQGARLTAWELARAGIPATLITDGMAASVLGHARAAWNRTKVFVGADRIAANGDVANKVGTFGLALIARGLNALFYVVAPLSTIDLNTTSGGDIPIEQRDESEVTEIGGARIAPEGVRVANPAFDVTPSYLITAIITEAGVVYPPYRHTLPALLKRVKAEQSSKSGVSSKERSWR
jgi:methylthioribose-1-phosphate isomerase